MISRTRLFSSAASVALVIATAAIGSAPAAAAAPPRPRFAHTIGVLPAGGRVLVRIPGARSVRLIRGEAVPVGSVIDMSAGGSVILISAAPNGRTVYTADVTGGIVRVTQPRKGRGRTDIDMRVGTPGCSQAGTTIYRRHHSKVTSPSHHRYAVDAAAGRSVGAFRLIGSYQAATNQGPATWTATNTCGNTTVADSQGNVNAQLPNGSHPQGAGPGSSSPGGLSPGETWQSWCSSPAQPALPPVCVAVLGSRDASGFVSYTTGLFTTAPLPSYQVCESGPAGHICRTLALSAPDTADIRSGVVSCTANVAGSYSFSWTLGGVDLAARLGYSASKASNLTGPCWAAFGAPIYPLGGYYVKAQPDVAVVNQYALPAAGWIGFMSAFVEPVKAGKANIQGVIYADNGGTPGALLGTTEVATVRGTDAADYVFLNITHNLYLPAGQYWFGLLVGGQSGVVALRFDRGARALFSDDSFAAGANNPFGSSVSADARFSFHIGYSTDPSAGQ